MSTPFLGEEVAQRQKGRPSIGVLVECEPLREWVAAILCRAGVPAPQASSVARMMLRTDSRGIRTHGVTRLASYVQKLRSGEVNPDPQISTHPISPNTVLLEADGALGQLAMSEALRLGVQGLDSGDMRIVLVRECGHLGALGLYALMAAEAGYFSLVAQRTPALMALPGFEQPAVGNNPIAFGCPISGADPLVFDMACSVAARGHILLRARSGEPIPEGWALDARGEPTTEAAAALSGALLPSAGHKGMGIAMLVECLSAGLLASERSIAALAGETGVAIQGAVGRQGAFMLLINQRVLSGGYFDAYMSRWTEQYKRKGGRGARLPGARGAELERAVRSRGSLDISQDLYRELCDLATEFDLEFPAVAPA